MKDNISLHELLKKAKKRYLKILKHSSNHNEEKAKKNDRKLLKLNLKINKMKKDLSDS